MRKLLLSLSALTLALSLNAQTTVHKAQNLTAQKSTHVSQRVVTLSAQKKAGLASNQRYFGYYTTDDLAEYGLGIPNYGENDCKAAAYFTNDMLAPFAGSKIVAIRFGLACANGSSRVFIAPVTSNGIEADDVSKDVSSTVAGWNQVTLDTPYEIKDDATRDLFIGFDFKQYATKSGSYYTNDCYPLSLVDKGEESILYIYANISSTYGGQGKGWYGFGSSNGNLSLQAIIEGDFADYSVTPSDFSQITASVNDEVSVPVEFYNFSSTAVTDLDYVVTVNGVVGAEQHVSLSEAVASCNTGVFYTKVPTGSETGDKKVTIEITKVNGNENGSDDKVCEGTLAVVDQVYARNVLIEEMTTEMCGNCPRVAGYLHNSLKTADPSRVFAVCHHAGYGSDWLSNGTILSDSYKSVKPGTGWDGPLLYLFSTNGNSFAPAMTFNRSYHSDYNANYVVGCFDMPLSSAEITKHCKEETDGVANAKLSIQVTPNADETQATVVVTGEQNGGIDDANTFLTLYVTEDSIQAHSQSGASGKFYHMHVIRYSNAVGNFGDDVEWVDNKFTKTFTVALDSKWVKNQLKFVALLDHRNEKDLYDNKVENVIGMDYPDPTGIKGITNDTNAIVVARYNAAGQRIDAPQKGLNIVKLSNGKTYKEMVK